jgi:CRP-like cAMP-binding protein
MKGNGSEERDRHHLQFLSCCGKMPFMNFEPSAFVAESDLFSVLRKHAFAIDCRVDTPLFQQGEDPTGLHILQSGEATMILEDSQRLQVASVPLAPGALLGLPALISDKPYSMSAVAKAGAQVGFVTRHTFSALMLSDPLLALMVLRVLAAEVHSARSAITERTTPPRRRRALRRKGPMQQRRRQLPSE